MRLLRYRFDTVAQVSRHFHLANGRVVLFYPTLLALTSGEPVLLDAGFADSEQHCVLRGTVLGNDGSARYVGSWLEFTAHGLVASLRSTLATPKRRMRRFPADLIVNLQRAEGMPVVGKLVDVGFGGARIAGVGLKTSAGDKVRLSLFSRDSGAPAIAARVAWARGAEIGLEFIKPSPAERATIGALTDQARHALASAYEATHPVFCSCLSGNAVAEPPLPRAAHRQTAST